MDIVSSEELWVMEGGRGCVLEVGVCGVCHLGVNFLGVCLSRGGGIILEGGYVAGAGFACIGAWFRV